VLSTVDRMSMAVALEARVPVLDHKVVEFAARLPFDYRLRLHRHWRTLWGRLPGAYETKWLLKEAMRSHLPAENLRQRKQGFSVPIHDWFQGDLGEQTVRLVEGSDAGPGHVSVDGVRRLLSDHRAGRRRNGHQLWRVLAFEVWKRVCLNGQSETAPEEGEGIEDWGLGRA